MFVLASLLQLAICLPIVDPGERSPVLRTQTIVDLPANAVIVAVVYRAASN
jgi:hypothetical protein